MQALTQDGQNMVNTMAARHGVSSDAVCHLLQAIAAGGGGQAQFNHPELGGMGQWQQGGMIMVGDMFNQGLKYRVDTLCNDLAGALAMAWPFMPAPMAAPGGAFAPGGFASRWPAELGMPAASGSQNAMHYAVFPAARRLAVEQDGQVSVYDTGDHQIGGVSQQQGGDQSLTFTSQYGPVRLLDLPLVSPIAAAPVADPAPVAPPPVDAITAAWAPVAPPISAPTGMSDDEIFSRIERLGDLRKKEIITDEEFSAKKAELLARL